MKDPLIHGMVQIRDAFFQALWALKDNRLRTILSILGILVGIVAVMAVGTVTKTFRHTVFSEIESYGLKKILVYRLWEEKGPYSSIRKGSGMDNGDLEFIVNGCCPAVARVSPDVYYEDWKRLVRTGSRYNNAFLEGVGVDYLAITKEQLVLGRNFRPEDMLRHRTVAIIGSEVKKQLFGPNINPVGRSIRLENLKLTIIGLLKEKRRDFLSSIGAAENYDVNNRVLIPYTLHQQILGSKDIHTLVLEATETNTIQQAAAEVIDVLKRRHNYRFTYTSDNMETWIDTYSNYLNRISLFGIAAASISLLVGGIGIMNIMTTSVLERTREIGIRKAIGARRRDILVQFLMEAIFISTLGGGLGLIVGIIVSLVAALWTDLPTTPSWTIVFIALLVSMFVGMVSGYYPAKRAAGLKPVEALRYQ
jgi:putative ABC transport system permease protein